jgi:hypothetical protein
MKNMSYIPKYILKRMLPKDCVTLEGDLIKVAMTNVISPISIDEIPDDVLNYLELKVDDKVVEDLSGLKILWEDKEFTLANIADAVGETLPVGGKMTLVLPNSVGVAKGEKHDIEVIIKADNPINIKVSREVM